MKEYRYSSNGRYVFNEDIENLQDLALSSSELFRDCKENFVISGCDINITENDGRFTINVDEGYVWLDGKIRVVGSFEGAALISDNINIHIFAKLESGPNIRYLDGSQTPQYNNYTAETTIGNVVPEGAAYITAIRKTDGTYEFPNLRTMFFAHYCLLKSDSIETVDDLVPRAGCTMLAGAELSFVDNNNTATLSPNGLITNGTVNSNIIVVSNGISVRGGGADITGDIELLGNFNAAGNGSFSMGLTVTGAMTAGSFIKNGGLSTQFLKADGSVDGNSYMTIEAVNTALAGYLPLTGGTLSGRLIVNDDCTVSGVLQSSSILRGVDGDFSGELTTQACTIKGELDAKSTAIVRGAATFNSGILVMSGNVTAAQSDITGKSFIKNGGTSSQYLMADGSVKSDVYALASDLADTDDAVGALQEAITGYLPLTGGTLTGKLICNANIDCIANDGEIQAKKFIVKNGTSTQFLKGDGSVDGTSYVSTSTPGTTLEGALSNYLPLTGGTLRMSPSSATSIKFSPDQSQIEFANDGVSATIYLTNDTKHLRIQNALLEVASGATFYGDISVNGEFACAHANGISARRIYINPDTIGGNAVSGFLKTGGVIDTNSYLPLTGGTMSGDLVCNGSNGITANKFVVNTQVNGFLKANGTVDATNYLSSIADGSITRSKIAGGAVDTDKLEDSSVESDKIASNAIYSNHIADAQIITRHLGNLVVDTSNIKDRAVNASKIALHSIDSNCLAPSAVDTGNIRLYSIEFEHFRLGALGISTTFDLGGKRYTVSNGIIRSSETISS